MKKTLSLLLLTFLGLAAPAQRVEVSTGLPGALGTLSTWNGGGLLTNAASPEVWIASNLTTSIVTTNYTIPPWSRVLLIEAVGPGGQGASGRVGAAGSVRCGGGGGAGGAYSYGFFNASYLRKITNTLFVDMGNIGTGGASQTNSDSDGLAGANSRYTLVGLGSNAQTNWLIVAYNGARGSAGTATGGSGGTGGSGSFPGANGGSASGTGGAGGAGSSSSVGSTGGGSGGGITTGDVPSAGGAGGNGPAGFFGTSGGGAAGVVGANGTNSIPFLAGLNIYALPMPGSGGGGSQTNANAGAGAGGGGWGAGGGGGGAALNGYASGAGGNGGGTIVRITAYWTCPAISFSDWVGAVAQWIYDTATLLKHLAIPEIEFNPNEVTQ